MARTPKPWFRKARNCWYVNIEGTRYNLGPDKDDAARQFHTLMADPAKRASHHPAPAVEQRDSLSVLAVLDFYLAWCQKNREPGTFEWAKRHVVSFLKTLASPKPQDMPYADLRPYHLLDWVDSHPGWGDNSRRGGIAAVQRAFRWAKRVGRIDSNPIADVDKPAAKRRETFLTQIQFDTLIAHFKPESRFRLLLEWMWHTGARPQEVVKIQTRHVHLAAKKVELPASEAKGKRRVRVILMNDAAVSIVQKTMKAKPDDFVFRCRNGKPWTKGSIVCRFFRLKERTGLAVCATMIRHGFCQRMLEAGHDHLTVAALLGHANGQMVSKVYSHISSNEGHLRKVIDGQ
jgi:site-specific recombinase XerD